jgi:alpha-methylacyl-CoA racemase
MIIIDLDDAHQLAREAALLRREPMTAPAASTPEPRQGPLAGIKVLELAGLGPAQLGGMLLADTGADVIRLDRPTDVRRSPVATHSNEVLARGRRSIALDLKTADGRQLALLLVAACDVLLDPYRPGVTERLGLGPDVAMERNPRLVYARMTGWGQTGPLAHAAGHDINYIGLTGALHAIGDFGGGGMLLAFAVAAALVERGRSGRGQVIDVAMIDGVASLLTSIFQLEAMDEWDPERGANWLQGAAPWYRAYETADGRYVTVGTLEPQFYDLLLRRLEFDPDEWPQWDRELWPALSAQLENRFASRSLAQWSAELEGTDACFAPALRIDEVAEHPHLAARQTYVEYEGVTQPAPVPRFERTPGAIASPPPWAGEHTIEILTELGIAESRRNSLVRAGAAAQLTTEERV